MLHLGPNKQPAANFNPGSYWSTRDGEWEDGENGQEVEHCEYDHLPRGILILAVGNNLGLYTSYRSDRSR